VSLLVNLPSAPLDARLDIHYNPADLARVVQISLEADESVTADAGWNRARPAVESADPESIRPDARAANH
jgi:hypothetical protein